MSDPISYKKMEFVPGPWADMVLLPDEQLLGSRDNATVGPGWIRIEDQFTIEIGNKPQVYRLADLYAAGHNNTAPDPNQFPSLNTANVWLVVHAVGAMKRRGPATLRALGYRASFSVDDEIATVGMMPDSLYVDHLRAAADLDVEGSFDLSQGVAGLLAQGISLATATPLRFSSGVKVVGKIGFAVRTRAISTMGINSSHCEWLFRRSGDDLYRDHIMLQTIRVPPKTTSLTFTAQAYAEIGDWWELTSVPRLLWTAELPLQCTPVSPKIVPLSDRSEGDD